MTISKKQSSSKKVVSQNFFKASTANHKTQKYRQLLYEDIMSSFLQFVCILLLASYYQPIYGRNFGGLDEKDLNGCFVDIPKNTEDPMSICSGMRVHLINLQPCLKGRKVQGDKFPDNFVTECYKIQKGATRMTEFLRTYSYLIDCAPTCYGSTFVKVENEVGNKNDWMLNWIKEKQRKFKSRQKISEPFSNEENQRITESLIKAYKSKASTASSQGVIYPRCVC